MTESRQEIAIETLTHDGLPPEWASQSGVMLTWPHRETIWAETLTAIDEVFCLVAKEITTREKLLISCFDQAHKQHIENLLTKAGVNKHEVSIYSAPCDDIWVRDHGPIVVYQKNKPVLLNFIFNGWGNKYPSSQDNQITTHLQAQHAFNLTAHQAIPMVLEGGAIEVDGMGTLLTTSRCLLSSSRNPSMSKDEISNQLKKLFGIKRILWLNHGYLAGDDTDSHIDTLARFTDTHTICYVSCDDKQDEHYDELKAMEKELQCMKDYQGKPYRLIALPWPKARYADEDGRRLPATYANFLIINDAVLVPTYDDPSDELALSILENCFPHRSIIGIPCLAVIQWYGSLHCMTMQLPAGVLS